MKLADFDFRIWVGGFAIANGEVWNGGYIDDSYMKKNQFNKVMAMGLVKFYDKNKEKLDDIEFFTFYNNVGFNHGVSNDIEIELWSGFCDKFGKKIYEGDIVCFKNRGKYNDDRDEVLAKHIKEKCLKKTFLTQIFFKNEGGGYCIKRQTKRGHTKYFSLFDMSFYLNFTLEVVGNIHENADLLEYLSDEEEQE